MKAPNSKLQAPEKHQAPTIKQTASLLFGASMFGISLELGAWDLELPPGSPFSARLITRKRFAICAGSEHQAPSSREAPSTKNQKGDAALELRCLEFLWCLELGIWSFRRRPGVRSTPALPRTARARFAIPSRPSLRRSASRALLLRWWFSPGPRGASRPAATFPSRC